MGFNFLITVLAYFLLIIMLIGTSLLIVLTLFSVTIPAILPKIIVLSIIGLLTGYLGAKHIRW